MKRNVSRKVSRALIPLIILGFSNITTMQNANAAIFTETFGSSTCSIQTPDLVITQNGTDISYNSAGLRNVYLSTSYGTSFGMKGCNINLYQPLNSVLVTFPVSSQPTKFWFYAGAVDGGKIHSETLTYVDDTIETFTVKNTDPNAGETVTVTGNGKLIKSFSLNAWLPGGDYWFLDNLSWDTSALPATIFSISVSTQANNKGLVSTISATSNNNGRVTFFANGKRIPKCISLAISTSRTCTWRPSIQGMTTVRAIFTPTNLSDSSATAQIQTIVSRRLSVR
jgi:hypothetical protein